MPTEKDLRSFDSETSQNAGSAPELPHEVAKEYGIHKDGVHPTEPSLKTEDEQNETNDETIGSPGSDERSIDDDPKTDAAVDDILTKESDQLLAVQDGNVPHAELPHKQRGFWGKIGHFFAAWWQNKWARWITIIILLAAIVTVSAIPKARYKVLNTVGVRSSASVVVLDNTTQLPLKNVTVTIGDEKSLTNRDGKATFKDLKLGDYQLAIKRIAFASYKQKVTIGWGSNPLGAFKIKATGIQYVLLVTDFISGKPVEGAEVISDEANALSDKNGKIILTVEDTATTKLSVSLNAKGYKSQQLMLDAAIEAPTKVVLVPAAKQVFVSNQSGKYDVYASDLDGQNRKLLLAGTGNEGANISLVVSPDGTRAAMVATRDNLRDGDGYLMQALTIIDLARGTSVTVDHAEQLQLIDWIGNRLIYRMTLAGASASNSQRSRIISYNYDTNARVQLANANQFNAVFSTRGFIYYTASSTDPDATMGLFKVKSDGTSRKRLSDDETWTALRTGYNVVSVQTPDGWRSFDIEHETFTKTGQPPTVANVPFVDNTDATASLWTEQRDGQGTLLLHNNSKNTDKVLVRQDGIAQPIRWVSDDLIIYRVSNTSETADYAVSTKGGQPHKLTDVTATFGFAQIY
jgi:hypothetical protein